MNLIVAVIAGIVSIVLPSYPDLAGDEAPVWPVFFLCLGIWQTLDGIKRLFERRSPRFEFLLSIFAYSMAGLLSLRPDASTKPIWIVVATAVVCSCLISFFKRIYRDVMVKS